MVFRRLKDLRVRERLRDCRRADIVLSGDDRLALRRLAIARRFEDGDADLRFFLCEAELGGGV